MGVVKQDPAVQHVVGFTTGTNSGILYTLLKSREERGISSDEVIALDCEENCKPLLEQIYICKQFKI